MVRLFAQSAVQVESCWKSESDDEMEINLCAVGWNREWMGWTNNRAKLFCMLFCRCYDDSGSQCCVVVKAEKNEARCRKRVKIK